MTWKQKHCYSWQVKHCTVKVWMTTLMRHGIRKLMKVMNKLSGYVKPCKALKEINMNTTLCMLCMIKLACCSQFFHNKISRFLCTTTQLETCISVCSLIQFLCIICTWYTKWAHNASIHPSIHPSICIFSP